MDAAIIARCYVYALKLKSHGDGSSERKKHGESRAEQTDGGGVVDAAATAQPREFTGAEAPVKRPSRLV